MNQEPKEPFKTPARRHWTLVALVIAAAIVVGAFLQSVSSPEGPFIGRILIGVCACLFVISRAK